LPKKNSGRAGQRISLAILMLAGMAVGFIGGIQIGSLADRTLGEDAPFLLWVLLSVCGFMLIYVAYLVQTVLHEGGHLVGGLLSGYRFCSFRIGSFMWVEKAGKIRFRRFSLMGTGGQCLMCPPDPVDGRVPVKLYNFGGVLANLLFSGIFALLWALVRRQLPWLGLFCLFCVIMGVPMALTNGIPMRVGAVDNDGRNALSLENDPGAMRSFWVQMKINELITRDIRLKDMPAEWFAAPPKESMDNPLCASIPVFALNRVMDEGNLEEATRMSRALLESDSGILPVHRYLVTMEAIFCELMGETRREELDRLRSREFRQFEKAMKTNPSLLRMQYAWALLADRNEEEAKKILTAFERAAKTYPHQTEIQGEREWIARVNEKYDDQKKG